MRANTAVFRLTLALRDARGAIEISGGVAGAGNAVVLSELCLIGANGAADAAVNRGVVVMTRGALDCRGRGMKAVYRLSAAPANPANTELSALPPPAGGL